MLKKRQPLSLQRRNQVPVPTELTSWGKTTAPSTQSSRVPRGKKRHKERRAGHGHRAVTRAGGQEGGRPWEQQACLSLISSPFPLSSPAEPQCRWGTDLQGPGSGTDRMSLEYSHGFWERRVTHTCPSTWPRGQKKPRERPSLPPSWATSHHLDDVTCRKRL